jgi:hypothetical protein
MEEKTVLPAGGPEREFHAVANLFPLMQGAAFEELVADIKKNGQREPILCDGEGRILDGRNRYRACRRAGVEPRFVTWDGEGSPTEVALSLNLRRRHLNESQRAMVAARWAALEEQQHRGRPLKKRANLPSFPPGKLAGQAAVTFNVSTRLVTAAIKVAREGSTGLITAVDENVLSVSTAALLAGLPREEQEQLLAGGPDQVARKARELRGAAKPTAPAEERRFGVMVPGEIEARGDTAVLLWVARDNLNAAVEALQVRGFRYAEPGARGGPLEERERNL